LTTSCQQIEISFIQRLELFFIKILTNIFGANLTIILGNILLKFNKILAINQNTKRQKMAYFIKTVDKISYM